MGDERILIDKTLTVVDSDKTENKQQIALKTIIIRGTNIFAALPPFYAITSPFILFLIIHLIFKIFSLKEILLL